MSSIKERFLAICSSSQDAIVVVDKGSRVLFWNSVLSVVVFISAFAIALAPKATRMVDAANVGR